MKQNKRFELQAPGFQTPKQWGMNLEKEQGLESRESSAALGKPSRQTSCNVPAGHAALLARQRN